MSVMQAAILTFKTYLALMLAICMVSYCYKFLVTLLLISVIY